jgi:N-methylhydantoinase B
MWAGIAGARSGAARIVELTGKYGKELFLAAMADYMDFGEKVSLRMLAEAPVGRYSLAEEQDDGQIFHTTVELTGSEMIIDLQDNPAQASGSTNLSRDCTIIAAQMAFKAFTAPDSATNAGTFRPLKVLTRPGTLFDASSPAAEGFYFENLIRVQDLILRCLANIFPGRIPAGNFASVCGTFIGGIHPDTGRRFLLVEPEVGGWGGETGRDGNNAMFSALHGETYICPAEISEGRYGLFVDCMELNEEAGGYGKFRGGLGIRIDYRVRAAGTFLTCGYTRSRIAPWGLNGGADGSLNYVEVARTDGTVQRYAFVSSLMLDAGDVIRVRTGSGGGNGNPRERSRQAVLEDLRNGYVSPAVASEVYGVKTS